MLNMKKITGIKKAISFAFVRGYAASLCMLLRYEGKTTSITDEMFRAGIGSIKEAEEANVEEYDLLVLKKYY